MKFSLLMRSLTFIVLAGAAVAQPTVVMNAAPTRVLGQAKPNVLSGGVNLVEGRELYQPQSVWVDVASATSILYVADTRNNRVLAWRNGAAANAGTPADLVIGQRDLQSTAAQGPDPSNSRLSSGLNGPTSVITDAVGNLYVADSGNNRILRYPRPFQQNSELLQVDLVIGQRSINENLLNQGAGVAGMTETSLFLSQPFGTSQRAGMAFDAQRNLWVTDPQNHRVLRYPVAALDRGGFAPAADLVLGGADFTSSLGRGTSPYQQDIATKKDFIWDPSGIGFDSRGRLFVRDWAPGFSRVLVWDVGTPFFNGKAASRIVGIPTPPATGTLPAINEYVAGGFNQGAVDGARPGIFLFGTNLYVPDVNSNRILIFDAYDNWPAEATRYSPAARSVIGQDSFNLGRANRNGLPVGSNGFFAPVSVWVGGSDMYVADTFNNRVLVMPGRDFAFNAASRVIGQLNFTQNGPNLVEGKEFYFLDGFTGDRSAASAFGALGGTCVALDGDRLYVADSQNNRILGFSDVRRIRGLDSASLVIGQTDLFGSIPNAPGGDAGTTSERGLNAPTCVAVDKDGNLWVADTGNGRVLRFPRPFDQTAAGLKQPNLVLGQSSFTIRSTDPTSRTMRAPAGLAFLSDGSVLVSDYLHNRVLRFRKPAGSDFQNGQAADGVFGQANFTDSVRGNTLNRFQAPKGIATDSEDRLYVAEVVGNRVLIFSEAGNATSNATARQDFSGLGGPQAVYVSPQTGDIWVSDTANQRIFRLLPFSQLPVGTNITPEQVISAPFPLALGLDRRGEGLRRLHQALHRRAQSGTDAHRGR
jgi:sugar lactone lactonase YvrE